MRRLVDGRLQFHHLQRGDGILGDGTRGHARAEPDQRDLGRMIVLVEQERQQTHADLGRHVGVVGGVDLAVVLQREHLAPLVDRHRRGDAVLVVDQLGNLPFLLLVAVLDHLDVVARHGDAKEADGEVGEVPARQGQGQQGHADRAGHAEDAA